MIYLPGDEDPVMSSREIEEEAKAEETAQKDTDQILLDAADDEDALLAELGL